MTSQDVLKGGTVRQWRSTNGYGDSANNGNLRKQWTETATATFLG